MHRTAPHHEDGPALGARAPPQGNEVIGTASKGHSEKSLTSGRRWSGGDPSGFALNHFPWRSGGEMKGKGNSKEERIRGDFLG